MFKKKKKKKGGGQHLQKKREQHRVLSTSTCGPCHSNSVNTGSFLPRVSDVKTRKRRNVVGIDMIRNNRIVFYTLNIFISEEPV